MATISLRRYAEKWKRSLFFKEKGSSVFNTDTCKAERVHGIPVFVENTITKSSDEEKYYVSYNPSKRDYGIDTTALVITIGDNERQVFYILSGNHKEQYDRRGNLTDCIRYFARNKEHAHSMSDAFEHQSFLAFPL